MVDRQGVETPLIQEARNYLSPRFSPTGDLVAVAIDGDIRVYDVDQGTLGPLRAGASGELAVRPSLIAQKHGGALLSGGKPGNPGHNQLTVRQRAQAVRGQLIGRSEHSSRRVAAKRPSLIPQFRRLMAVSYFRVGRRAIQGTISTR